MVTVRETSETTLETPDQIAAYLGKSFDATSAAFEHGEVVSIAKRDGMIPEFGVGDVAVVLVDLPGNPYTWVWLLHSSGTPSAIQVPTGNLAKREPAQERGA